jgi:hypothetical protein
MARLPWPGHHPCSRRLGLAIKYGGTREVQTRFYEERQNPLLAHHQALLGWTRCYLRLLVHLRLHRLPRVSTLISSPLVRALIFRLF